MHTQSYLLSLALSLTTLGCASRTAPQSFPEGSPASLETPAPEPWMPHELASKAAPEPAQSGPGGHQHHSQDRGAGQQEADIYVCPMHPHVISSEPGECPLCGMSLEEKQ